MQQKLHAGRISQKRAFQLQGIMVINWTDLSDRPSAQVTWWQLKEENFCIFFYSLLILNTCPIIQLTYRSIEDTDNFRKQHRINLPTLNIEHSKRGIFSLFCAGIYCNIDVNIIVLEVLYTECHNHPAIESYFDKRFERGRRQSQ